MRNSDTISTTTQANGDDHAWRRDAFPDGREDGLGYVERRVRQRELARSNPAFPKWRVEGKCGEAQYKAWLLKSQGRSFQWIGDLLFDTDATPEGRKTKAYRAYRRVEKELSGNGPTPIPTPGQITALMIR